MLPIQWTTEFLQIAIRTGIVLAEMQTTIMLRMMGLTRLPQSMSARHAAKAPPETVTAPRRTARRKANAAP